MIAYDYATTNNGESGVSTIFMTDLPNEIDGTDNNLALACRDFKQGNFSVIKNKNLVDMITTLHQDMIIIKEDLIVLPPYKGIYVEIMNSKLSSIDVSGFKQYLAGTPITVYARTKNNW